MEEFQGYDDIWTAILDERVLLKLGDKIDAMREKALEPRSQSQAGDSQSRTSSARFDRRAGATAPSNFKLIDTTIKSEVQRDLYRQFMKESKQEHAGLKFDLMKAQEPTSEAISKEDSGDDVPEYTKSMKSRDAMSAGREHEKLLTESKGAESAAHALEEPGVPLPAHAVTQPGSARELQAVGSESLEATTLGQSREPVRLTIDPVGHGLLRPPNEEEKREDSAELTATARRRSPKDGEGIAIPADPTSSADPVTEQDRRALPVSGLGSEGAVTGQITESARADMPGALAKSGSPPGSHGGLAPSALGGSHAALGQAQSQVNLGETKAEQLEAEIAAAGATLEAKKSAKSLQQKDTINEPSEKATEEDKK